MPEPCGDDGGPADTVIDRIAQDSVLLKLVPKEPKVALMSVHEACIAWQPFPGSHTGFRDTPHAAAAEEPSAPLRPAAAVQPPQPSFLEQPGPPLPSKMPAGGQNLDDVLRLLRTQHEELLKRIDGLEFALERASLTPNGHPGFPSVEQHQHQQKRPETTQAEACNIAWRQANVPEPQVQVSEGSVDSSFQQSRLETIRRDMQQRSGTGLGGRRSTMLNGDDAQQTASVRQNLCGPVIAKIAVYVDCPAYDAFMTLILVLNMAAIGIESDNNRSGMPSPQYFGSFEYVFTACYTADLMLQFLLNGRKVLVQFITQVDAVVLLLAYAQIIFEMIEFEADEAMDIIGLLKVLRLARIIRGVRLLVYCRPLYILVYGLMTSMDTLLWTFVVLIALIYVFAVLGLEIIREDLSDDVMYKEAVRQNFPTLGVTMMTLIQGMTMDGFADVYRPMVMAMPWLAVYFTSFFLIVTVSLMNLVTAIIVETSRQTIVHDAAARKAVSRGKAKNMAPHLREIFEALDGDRDGHLNITEVMTAPQWVRTEIEAITTRSDMEEIYHLLDWDGNGDVTVAEFVEGIIRSADEDAVPLELVRILGVCKKIQILMQGAANTALEVQHENIPRPRDTLATTATSNADGPNSMLVGLLSTCTKRSLQEFVASTSCEDLSGCEDERPHGK